MEHLQKQTDQEEVSRVSDIDKAHYMAEVANSHARRAVFGREMIRASNKAETIKLGRQIDVTEAIHYGSDMFEILEKVQATGIMGMAEITIPPLGKVKGRIRSKYRDGLDNWAQKQDILANRAADQAAERYDANEGHPHRIADIDKAHKKAKKTKKQIERSERQIAGYREIIAKIDAGDQSARNMQERGLQQKAIDQTTEGIDLLKRS